MRERKSCMCLLRSSRWISGRESSFMTISSWSSDSLEDQALKNSSIILIPSSTTSGSIGSSFVLSVWNMNQGKQDRTANIVNYLRCNLLILWHFFGRAKSTIDQDVIPTGRGDRTLTTSSGKLASSATCIPKLWSQIPRSSSEMKTCCKKVYYTRFDFVQECNVSLLVCFAAFYNMCNNMQIFHMWNLLIQCGKLVKVGCKKAKSMYLRGDVSTEVMSVGCKGEKPTFITLISPKQGQNHHRLMFLIKMRRDGQLYQAINSPRPNSSMMIRESLVADCWQGDWCRFERCKNKK